MASETKETEKLADQVGKILNGHPSGRVGAVLIAHTAILVTTLGDDPDEYAETVSVFMKDVFGAIETLTGIRIEMQASKLERKLDG